MKQVKEQTPIRNQGMQLENEVITWTQLQNVFNAKNPKKDWKCPIVTPRF
ncbi:hypothetical protein G5B00_02645 [Parapedobacter sp. SGR-10]|nr:hypothetical protein [Parapedobacter sp. SGR-10]NGF55400.1 hypothetical protein [Parapedobacter sp. SGR-10]